MEKVYYLITPEGGFVFEFDEEKSCANKAKHGIDFVEAQRIWLDRERIVAPARDDVEVRFLVLGRIGDRLWSAFITYRGTRIRLISVRRSREKEARAYGAG